jgi:hypothetical protein
MRHAFTVDTPTGKACSICGLHQRENDLVPRCESMPHWGHHYWAPGDAADALVAELVGADDAARAARAMPVTTTAKLRRALRAGGT